MKKLALYILLLLALPTSLLAQTIKTVGTGGNYGRLKLAFDAINSGNITGNIILQIVGNSTETASTILHESGYNGTANYTSVTIYPTVSGKTISGNISGALIELNGATNVTFDGRVNESGSADLIISNTNTGTSSTTIRFIDDAQTNLVEYCTIKGSETNTASGVIFFSTTTVSTGNSNNTIDHNNITSYGTTRPLNALFSSGTSGKENSGNIISNNNFYDFLNKGIASNGIFLSSNTTTWTISGNSFYETASFTPTADIAYNAIQIDNTSGTGFTITGNSIGGNLASCGGSAWTKTIDFDNSFNAISLNAGTGTVSNVQNNIIKNFDWSNSLSSSWTGILIMGGDINVGTSAGNTIGSDSGTGSITITNAQPGSYSYGINIIGTGIVDCQNNIIGSITTSNDNANDNSFYGINKDAVTGTINISNNTIGSTTTVNSINASSLSASNAQFVCGISNAGTGNITIGSNTIANITNGTTNSTVTTAGIINGIKSTAGNNTVSDNIIHDLTNSNANNSTTNSASVCGIALTGATLKTISGNTIYNLQNTFSSFTGSVIGIYFTGSLGSNTVTANFINSLSVTGASSTSASIYGIQVAAGATTYANNIISLGGNTQTTMYGFYETGTAGNNNNLYFNSIYISGIPTAGAVNSYALYSAGTANTRDFRNNIFDNARANSGATGTHYAIYLASATGATIDYNDYYTSGTGGMLGYLAGDISNLAAWQTATSQDANSLATNPLFMNAGGTAAGDYLPTVALSGVTGTGILTDYNGATRSLSSPTMGVFEVGGSCSNPTGGGTIAAAQSGCNPFDPSIFTSTAPASGFSGSSLEYKWQLSTTSDVAGFSDIASSNSLTYDAGPLTQTTWYKRLARVSCTGTWTGAKESNVLMITVNDLPVANPITGGNTVCANGTLPLTSNATGAPILSYIWTSSNNGTATVNNSGLVTAVSAGSADITYTVTDGNTCHATSPINTVTVNPLPAIGLTVGGPGLICSGTSTNITVALSETSVNYQLRNDNANELIGTPVTGNGGIIPLPTGPLTYNINFNVLAINATTSCSAQLTQKELVSIDPPSAGGSISGTSTTTYGSSTGTMTLGSYTGIIQRWEKRYNSGSWTIISNTNPTYSETPGSAGTWGYRAVVKSGTCSEANSAEFSITVNKALLTITADDKSKLYDGLVYSPFTVTYSGFVNSDTPAVLGGSLTFSGTAATATNAGSYVITPGGLTSANYTITFVNGQLTINKVPLTITADDKSKTYDGSVYSPFTVTYSGFVNSETPAVLGGSLAFSGTAIAATNAGSYVITPGGLTSANYTITFVNSQLTINKAPLTITADDKSKAYDGLVYSPFTVTYSGFVNSETPAVLGGSLSFSGTAIAATNAGSYVITPGGLTSGNYTISYANGQLTINKVPLTVTADDKSKAYDGLVYGPFTVTYSGFVNSETSSVLGGSLTFSGTAVTATNGGSYVITPGGLTSGNYTISYANGQLTINKTPLTVTADDKSKAYDGLVYSPFTVTYSGFVNSETSSVLGGSLTFSGSAATATNAGSYVIIPGGLTSGNYTISYANGQLTINKTPLTITADDKSKAYDGLVYSPFTVTYSGFVNSETSSVLGGSLGFSGSAATATNAGSYVIIPGGLTSGNYTISYANGQLTINKAPLTITADDKSKAYDGLVYSPFTVTYSGFVNSETSSVLGGSLGFSGSAATAITPGSYIITPAGLTSGNYTITFVDGQITINKAPLTITADDKSKAYDGLVYSPFTVTYSGFVNSETSTVLGGSLTFSGTALTATNAGSYIITPGGLTSGNYSIAFVNGQITINKAPLTITADDKSKAYDGLVYSPFTVTYSGFVNSETPAVLGGSLTFSGTALTATNAGSYIITPGGLTSGNYSIAFVNGRLTINKINLTLTADDKTKPYLAQIPVLTYSVSGFVNSETQSVLDVLPSITTTAVQNSLVGSYPITISGGSDNNYNYIYVTGTLLITKISQTITFTDVPEKLLVTDSYTLVATSTSLLPVLFESKDVSLATISGDMLTGVSKGSVQIRAFNSGDQNYNAAETFATVEIYSTHKDIMHLFTPNNDGINDYWELPELATWGKCSVRVFNRWGKLVFADDNYNNLWDGRSNGSPLPEGPYYFVIKTENAGTVTGTVNIVR